MLIYSETVQRDIDRASSRKQEDEDFELPFLDLDVIAEATDGFSDGNKLGQGGFGPVYKVIHCIFLADFQILRITVRCFAFFTREHWQVVKKSQ